MTPAALLTILIAVGCRLIPDGDVLRVQDPRRALTDALRQTIRERKATLLALLTPLACPYCQTVTPPEPNPPEFLCLECREVVGYLSKQGSFTPAPAGTGPIAWAERAAILEYAGGVSRGDAERLAWERLQASLVDPTVVGTSREKAGLWEDEACEDWATLQITSAGVLALAAKYPR
jgi:hypothetical protein